MSKSIHDKIAENIAKKMGTEYKSHKGIDIVKDKVIEVGCVAQGQTFKIRFSGIPPAKPSAS